MRLVYFGSGAFGLPTLRFLIETHEVCAIVTQPDRPAGRGSKLTPTPIATWAAQHAPLVPIIKPEKVNQIDIVAQIRGYNADAWVVIAFGQKLGRTLLDGVFAINLHASLLPRWRGAAPINAAILAGDTVTGNSVITLADRMDAGLILGHSTRPIDPLTTAGELHDLLASDGPALVGRVLDDRHAGRVQGVSQDENLVTIATKLGRDDGNADFNQRAEFIRRQVHALTPWPGVAIVVGDSKTPLKLLRVQATDEKHQQPAGSVIDVQAGTLACGHSSVLRVLEVLPAGKRAMPWADFARGGQGGGASRALHAGMIAQSAREAI